MSRWLELLLRAGAGPNAVIHPRPQIIGPKPSTMIGAPPRFAWDEKRWRRFETNQGIEIVGRYRVFDRARRRWWEFDGRLVQRRGEIAAYIAEPPEEMRRHRHGSCLQLVESPWFRLHWQRSPKGLDDALLYMERMLDESFNGR